MHTQLLVIDYHEATAALLNPAYLPTYLRLFLERKDSHTIGVHARRAEDETIQLGTQIVVFVLFCATTTHAKAMRPPGTRASGSFRHDYKGTARQGSAPATRPPSL